MPTELDAALRRFTQSLLDDAPTVTLSELRVTQAPRPVASRHRQRVWIGMGAVAALMGASAVLVSGGRIPIGTVTVIDTLEPSTQTSVTPGPTTPTAVPNGATRPLFDAEPEPIEWQTVTPGGTMARSLVQGLVAGPGGFVAIGLGFDNGNQGRVWHSVDGTGWTEPAAALFQPVVNLGTVVATSSWFFVAGAPNGTGESMGPWQLYRSPNGQTWEPIGPPSDTPASYATIGDILVRSDAANEGTMVSADGSTWSPASLVEFAPVPRAVTVEHDGIAYFVGQTRDYSVAVYQSDRPDRWSTLEEQPDHPSIYLADTPAGIVATGMRRNPSCIPVDPIQTTTTATDPTECSWKQSIALYTPSTETWTTITDDRSLSLPTSPTVVFGNQLLQLVPTDNTAIHQSSDGKAWTRTNATRATSASEVFLAANDTTVVGLASFGNAPGVAGYTTTVFVGR